MTTHVEIILKFCFKVWMDVQGIVIDHVTWTSFSATFPLPVLVIFTFPISRSRSREFQVQGIPGGRSLGGLETRLAEPRSCSCRAWRALASGQHWGGEPDSSYYYYGYLGKDAACWTCSACRAWWAGLWQKGTEQNNFSQYFMRLRLTMTGWGQV